jgi:hypothetical protein
MPLLCRPDLITWILGLGFFVGSKAIVFSTAPPHPALNASVIIVPFAVGGPAASKNGLGKLIPINVVSNLDIFLSSLRNSCHQKRFSLDAFPKTPALGKILHNTGVIFR